MKHSTSNPYFNLYLFPLIFMVFPLTGIFWAGYPLWSLPFSLLFLGAYLSLVYRWENLSHNVQAILWFYMLIYVIVTTLIINGGMVWFLFFLSNLMIYRFQDSYRSYRFVSFVIGWLTIVLLSVFLMTDIAYVILCLVSGVICLAMFILFKRAFEAQKQQEELAQKNAYINLLIAENERHRIGQDLHDSLGHVFALMTIKTELVLKQLEKGKIEAAKKEVSDLHQLSKDSMQNTRAIIHQLKEYHLQSELAQIVNIFRLSKTQLILKNDAEQNVLSPLIQSHLVMIIRELSNNVLKHANAKVCYLRLYSNGDEIVVEMEDDGKGFDQLIGDELHSIKERLTLLKGEVKIISKASPTLVRVILSTGEEL